MVAKRDRRRGREWGGGTAFDPDDLPTWKGTGESFDSVQMCIEKLKSLSKPFLDWAGKAEQHEVRIPTFDLFKHEELSTEAILHTVRSHVAEDDIGDLFDDLDPIDSINAYEHEEPWKNRLILGDSLQVMNSLVQNEGQAGKVQMVYFDPPYGVRFNSNFQPFVKKTNVSSSESKDMSREPEMVRAFRDTWSLGIHSYLTYIRDRAMLARTMLNPSGSIFVQISDTNVHYVRQVLDEVFGMDNFVSMISFKTNPGLGSKYMSATGDYIIWYAKDKENAKFNRIYEYRPDEIGGRNASHVLFPDGTSRSVSQEDRNKSLKDFPEGTRFYSDTVLAGGFKSSKIPVKFQHEGKTYSRDDWQTNLEGLERLASENRIHVTKNSLRYRRFTDDFPYKEFKNLWTDTASGDLKKIYVVKTAVKVIERCMHMTTEAGDIVMDITCGSGTTPFVAEKWGRRWIAIDTSRVPLALTRQRLLTSVFPWFDLANPDKGPAGGFVYKKKVDRKSGKHVGGLVPKITLKSIAQNEEPEIVRIVDRPEETKKKVRICGPFVFESTIQSVEDLETANVETADFHKKMLEILRNAKQLDLPGGESLALGNIRELPDCDRVQAECIVKVKDKEKKAAITFGPEDSYVGNKLLLEAHDEARRQGYDHLLLFGFGIMAKAQESVNDGMKVPTSYVDVKRDVVMDDLLETDSSSQIFSITGMPDVALRKAGKNEDGEPLYVAEINGLDVFYPGKGENGETEHTSGDRLPCWMLDSDYEEHGTFCPTQISFPNTDAWEKIMEAVTRVDDPDAWDQLDYLQGTESIPFTIGESGEIAVKVINERGDELMKVCKAKDAK